MGPIAAIINPVAGDGSAPARWRLVERRLHGLGLQPAVYYSTAPGDGSRKAREALAAGNEVVLAVGGDGTVHEVVRGLLEGGDSPAATLGVVPAGTGSDFARNLGLPRGPRAIADRIAANHTVLIDFGRVAAPAPDIFVNFAEVGLGAGVVARAA